MDVIIKLTLKVFLGRYNLHVSVINFLINCDFMKKLILTLVFLNSGYVYAANVQFKPSQLTIQPSHTWKQIAKLVEDAVNSNRPVGLVSEPPYSMGNLEELIGDEYRSKGAVGKNDDNIVAEARKRAVGIAQLFHAARQIILVEIKAN